MTTSTTMAINVSVFKNLAYDPAKDFVPVALVSGVPFVLVVNAGAAGELDRRSRASAAKAKPGGLTYASTGAGSAAHLYMVLLQNALGIEATGVPYKGNAPGLQDTIAGHVSVMFSDLLGALPHIRSRQAARARRHHQGPRAGGARSADAAGGRRDRTTTRRPGRCWSRPRRRRRRSSTGSTPSSTPSCASRRPWRDINGRGHIAVATPPVAELQRFVQSEIVRWAKVVEAAGAKGTQ